MTNTDVAKLTDIVVFNAIDKNGKYHTITYNASILPRKYTYLALNKHGVLYAYVGMPYYRLDRWENDDNIILMTISDIEIVNYEELCIKIVRKSILTKEPELHSGNYQ